MVRVGDQKMVAATFRHDTSRHLDPQLHMHALIANPFQGEDGKWRMMVDDGLFKGKMAIASICRAELAQGLKDLGYGIEKTHADGRFEIEGVPCEVMDAFSSRRAEIEAAMTERGLDHGRHWSTDAALARESEAIMLMRAGQGAEKPSCAAGPRRPSSTGVA